MGGRDLRQASEQYFTSSQVRDQRLRHVMVRPHARHSLLGSDCLLPLNDDELSGAMGQGDDDETPALVRNVAQNSFIDANSRLQNDMQGSDMQGSLSGGRADRRPCLRQEASAAACQCQPKPRLVLQLEHRIKLTL
jgi:hypothetical protein